MLGREKDVGSLSQSCVENDVVNQYHLHSILVHRGNMDSGHYYAFIRPGMDDRWYEFNDNIVRDFDFADLANECFGGEEAYSGQGLMNMKTQKWRNAYVVFYERKN